MGLMHREDSIKEINERNKQLEDDAFVRDETIAALIDAVAELGDLIAEKQEA